MKSQNSSIVVAMLCGIIIIASIVTIAVASFHPNFHVTFPSVMGISDIRSDNSSGYPRTEEGNETRHDTMPMEQIADRFGNVNEVLHDNRMMIEVNDFELTDSALNSADNFSVNGSLPNKFLMIDLSIRNIGHTLKISPNLFKLSTGTGDVIPPSVHTSSLDAGLRDIYLPNDLTIRTLLLFGDSTFVGDSSEQPPPVLEYSDGISVFSIGLLESVAKPSRSLSDIRPVPEFKIGEPMSDGSMRIFATATPFKEANKTVVHVPTSGSTNPTEISMTFMNIGNSTIHIEPSYLFILDNKSYVYAMDNSLTPLVSSPLASTDLRPTQSVSGSVVMDLPKNVSGLTFLYSGPNNSFSAKM